MDRVAEGEKLNMLLLIEVLNKIYSRLNRCEGVLVVSSAIDSKAATFCVLYLMVKFEWPIQDCLAFLHSKKPNVRVSPTEMRLLDIYDCHAEKGKITEIYLTEDTEMEEILLKNTLENSSIKTMPDFHGLTFKKQDSFVGVEGTTAKKKVRFRSQLQVVSYCQETEVTNATSATHLLVNNEAQHKVPHKQQPSLKKFLMEKLHNTKNKIEFANLKTTKEKKETDQFYIAKDKKRVKTEQPITTINSKRQENNFLKLENQDQMKLKAALYDFNSSLDKRQSNIKKDEKTFHIRHKTKSVIEGGTKPAFLKKKASSKKCITEESITDFLQKKEKLQQHYELGQAGFEQSIRIKKQPKVQKLNRRQRQRQRQRQGWGQRQRQRQRQKAKQQQSPVMNLKNLSGSSESQPQNIFNVNLNLQIDNVNFMRLEKRTKIDSKLKSIVLDDKKKNIKIQNTKKLLSKIRSELQRSH